MCGIFGIISESAVPRSRIRALAKSSQRRGSDSSGLIVYNRDKYQVEKADFDVLRLLDACALGDVRMVMGHTRLITDGEKDNQPVVLDDVLVIHNGIITNKDEFWRGRSDQRQYEIDTEVIARIVSDHLNAGGSESDIYDRLLLETKGAMSCAILLPKQGKLVLLSNTGSLYLGEGGKNKIFASERHFLKSYIGLQVRQIKGQEVINVPTGSLDEAIRQFSLSRKPLVPPLVDRVAEEKILEYKFPEIERCTRCILPSTMPFIKFDSAGVCNYCQNHETKNLKRAFEFDALLERYSSKFGNRVVVPFSGGRDSTYMVSRICREFGMEPITMTYDWGMVTDLARRNISRVCAELGIENILIADNIVQKRENIKKNLLAWLRKPDLGMVNILMAGDKHFFRHILTVKKELNVDFNLWGMNPLEVTHFKAGFLGFPPNFEMKQVFNTGVINQVRYQALRLKKFIGNPAYFNDSLFDTLSGEYYRSISPQRHMYNFFDYFPWEEKRVEAELSHYSWETAEDTDSTWRIGDGTAAFYNYVYYTLAGFTEFDTFRSNQIREGQLSRDVALNLVKEENQPRYQNIKWYLDTIGLDVKPVINRINNAPRHYAR